MCTFKNNNGEWMNDVHGLLNYDGELSIVVDHDDDYDFDYELPRSMLPMVLKQRKIQEKALIKFLKLDFTKVEELKEEKKHTEKHAEIRSMVESFCKRNKTVLPTLLYDDYCYYNYK